MCCLSEQLRVRADAGQHQNENVLVSLVHQKPVRLNVAFPASGVIAGERMVSVFRGEGNGVGKLS